MPSASVRTAATAEGWLLPQHARGIAQVQPDIAEHMSGRRSRRDGDRRLRLPQRRQVLRQQVALPELGECQTRGLVLRRAARHQLAPAVLEMLRELLDDLVLARRREPQRRQPRTHVFCPVRHVRLPSRVAPRRRMPPRSSAAGRGRASPQASPCRTGGGVRRASRPRCP